MRWRGPAALVALALLGGAGGYAAAELREEQPAPIPVAQPLPAQSPSYPVNVYDVEPDPTTAPLQPGLPLEEVVLRAGDGDGAVRVAVPRGWMEVPLLGPAWNFSVRGNPENTYVLRVSLLGGARQSVTVARLARIAALEDSEANGNLEHLDVEARDDDSFVATYLDGGYLRVAMERFLALGDSNTATVSVAITGREADREGMADLLSRVAASAERV